MAVGWTHNPHATRRKPNAPGRDVPSCVVTYPNPAENITDLVPCSISADFAFRTGCPPRESALWRRGSAPCCRATTTRQCRGHVHTPCCRATTTRQCHAHVHAPLLPPSSCPPPNLKKRNPRCNSGLPTGEGRQLPARRGKCVSRSCSFSPAPSVEYEYNAPPSSAGSMKAFQSLFASTKRMCLHTDIPLRKTHAKAKFTAQIVLNCAGGSVSRGAARFPRHLRSSTNIMLLLPPLAQ